LIFTSTGWLAFENVQLPTVKGEGALAAVVAGMESKFIPEPVKPAAPTETTTAALAEEANERATTAAATAILNFITFTPKLKSICARRMFNFSIFESQYSFHDLLKFFSPWLIAVGGLKANCGLISRFVAYYQKGHQL
jgi:hypothetical protein